MTLRKIYGSDLRVTPIDLSHQATRPQPISGTVTFKCLEALSSVFSATWALCITFTAFVPRHSNFKRKVCGSESLAAPINLSSRDRHPPSTAFISVSQQRETVT